MINRGNLAVLATAFLWAFCLLFTVPRAEAQVLQGSIVGDVADASNAPIAGATVIITQLETNQTRQSTTNQSGGFSFPTIPAGTYEITISREGFQKFTARGVVVTVEKVVRLDAVLQVGLVTEAVEVTAQGVALQTDRAEVRGELTTKALENLPVPIGRNYQNLLVTIPGFTTPANQHSVAANPSRGLTFNVNGTTRNANNVRIDGAVVNNPWPPHVTAYVPALEAINEVSVTTSSFDAEQGLSGGTAVSVQIRSGTNQMHGSLFEYHTNNALKARPFFLPADQSKPKLVDNQFWGTIGGPIIKNKLFYFGSYEGNFNRQNAFRFVTVPTEAMRAGNLSASPNPIYDPATGNADGSGRLAFANKVIPADRIDQISKKLIALLPLPTSPNLLTNNYYGTGSFAVTRHKLDSKVDWNVSEKLRVSGRLGWLRYNYTNPLVFGDLVGQGVSAAAGKVGKGFGDGYNATFSGTYTFRPTFI
jgi:Carboxypeptidase regulatory-like domain